MGNLLVENERVRIPKSKSNVMVRLDDYNSFRTHIQRAIFDSANNAWGGAGFAWAFCEFTSRDQMNEAHQARIWPEMRSTYQQSYFYIDFMRIQRDSAYQLNWQSSFRPDPSTYISIDIGRGRGILPHADIVHETGHAIGLAHEHQRLDRELYVTPINQSSYHQMLSNGQQIAPQTVAESVPFGPYDPDSVMHYPATFKRATDGSCIGGSPQNPIFPANPSRGDVYAAVFMYNEARIQDYLKIRNVGWQKQYLGMSAEVPGEMQAQSLRLAALAELYSQIGPMELEQEILSRTYEAVKNQILQLQRLQLQQPNTQTATSYHLDSRQVDSELLEWAGNNFRLCLQRVAERQQQQRPPGCRIL